MIQKVTPILLLLCLTACGPIDIEKFADDEKEATAADYVQKVIDGDFEGLTDSMEPSLRPKLTADLLNEMRTILGSSPPQESNLIGYNVRKRAGRPAIYDLTYQLGYANRWHVVNVAFQTPENGQNEIIKLNVYKAMERPLQEVNKFTFAGKGSTHYLFLLAYATVPLFILVTLIAAVRTPFKERKWVWIVFILMGIVRFSLNWTTGEIGVKPVSFQVLGAGAMSASSYAPWILSFSLPIGAALFWIKRRKLGTDEKAADPDVNAEERPAGT